MPGIFVSYRRQDSAGHVGWLTDLLRQRVGQAPIFRDLDGIRAGVDFVVAVQQAVASCEVLLAVIGQQWLSSTDAQGRRLDDPNDFVRLEIATALQRDIVVIPVLVQGAAMPPASALPADLAPLTRRNAIELSDARWQYDVERLVTELERVLESTAPTGLRQPLAQPEQPTPSAPPRVTHPPAQARLRRVLLLLLAISIPGGIYLVISAASGSNPAARATPTGPPAGGAAASAVAGGAGSQTQTAVPTAVGTPPTGPPPAEAGGPSRRPTQSPVAQPDAVVRVAANLRTGPGTSYPVIAAYTPGSAMRVLGQDAARQWVKVQPPDGRVGWFSKQLLAVQIPAGDIPILQPPTPRPPTRTRRPPTWTPQPPTWTPPPPTPTVVVPPGSD
jgi:uncharacterized protein YraI